MFYFVLLNAGKGRLAKEGSLALHTREKLSVIIRGVTANIRIFWEEQSPSRKDSEGAGYVGKEPTTEREEIEMPLGVSF